MGKKGHYEEIGQSQSPISLHFHPLPYHNIITLSFIRLKCNDFVIKSGYKNHYEGIVFADFSIINSLNTLC